MSDVRIWQVLCPRWLLCASLSTAPQCVTCPCLKRPRLVTPITSLSTFHDVVAYRQSVQKCVVNQWGFHVGCKDYPGAKISDHCRNVLVIWSRAPSNENHCVSVRKQWVWEWQVGVDGGSAAGDLQLRATVLVIW